MSGCRDYLDIRALDLPVVRHYTGSPVPILTVHDSGIREEPDIQRMVYMRMCKEDGFYLLGPYGPYLHQVQELWMVSRVHDDLGSTFDDQDRVRNGDPSLAFPPCAPLVEDTEVCHQTFIEKGV